DTSTAADPKGKRENYKGILVELGQTSLTLELKDGAAVTITLTDATIYKMRGRKNVGLADLQSGMQVMVQAVRAEDGSLTARRVMVIPAKPERVHRVGVVTAYTPNESITIQAKDDQLYTFLLTGETKILPKDRAIELAVGARVTIIAPRDPSASAPTARGIVVHPPQ
ncbi:MAG: DUF5666 domain-containing protein, partial [Anaerolineaceae bacterium]